MNTNKKSLGIILSIAVLFTLMGCGTGSQQDSISLTLTPMSNLVQETITARAASEGGSGNDLATAVSKATEKALDIHATQTARAELNEPSRLATATAMAPVVAELPRYGVDPADGYVAWLHNPAIIELNGFNQTGFVNDYPQITASDFVMAADITWNTRNSLSGCGFMFRSDGSTVNPNQYVVIITRVANGHMAFLAIADGKISNFREFFPRDVDKSFEWFNDTTNRLAVVAKGKQIDLYTNGVLIGQVDITEPPPDVVIKFPKMEIPNEADLAAEIPDKAERARRLEQYREQAEQYDLGNQQVVAQLRDAQKYFDVNQPFFYDSGLLGFLGMSQSGQMTCTFNNGWLFITKP